MKKNEEIDVSEKTAAFVKLMVFILLIVFVLVFSMYDKNVRENKPVDNSFKVKTIEKLEGNNFSYKINAVNDEDNLDLIIYRKSINSQFIKRTNINKSVDYFVLKNGSFYKVSDFNNINDNNISEVSEKDIYKSFDGYFLSVSNIISFFKNNKYEESLSNGVYSILFKTCDIVSGYNKVYNSSYYCDNDSKLKFDVKEGGKSIYIDMDLNEFYKVLYKKDINEYKLKLEFSSIGDIYEASYKELLDTVN
ncbi:MAG: hypothetical protein RSD00_02145 [Bacilli bacterium]